MLNVVMVKANAGGNDGAVVRIAISVPAGEQVRRRCRRRQRRRSIALVINRVRNMAFSSVRPGCDSARRRGYRQVVASGNKWQARGRSSANAKAATMRWRMAKVGRRSSVEKEFFFV